MKAGKEGPMYKNFGIGKGSPMRVQPPKTKTPPPDPRTKSMSEKKFDAATESARNKREEENKPNPSAGDFGSAARVALNPMGAGVKLAKEKLIAKTKIDK